MAARYGWLRELFSLLWRICLFQAGPQDLPVATLLLWGLIFLNVATGTLVVVPMASVGAALLVSAIGTGLLAVYLDLLLRLYDRRARFVQTMTAFTGTEIYFNFMVAGILWSVDWGDKTQTIDSRLVLLWMMIMVWSSAVRVVILRSALDSLISVSIFYLLVYGLISWQLTAWLMN